MPAKRNVFVMLFLLAWLGGWAAGEVGALKGLLSGTDGAKPFLLVWLAGWTFAGGFAALTWLWMLAGRERILLRPRTLAVRREVFGVGRTREYDLAHVRNLRVSTGGYDPYGWVPVPGSGDSAAERSRSTTAPRPFGWPPRSMSRRPPRSFAS